MILFDKTLAGDTYHSMETYSVQKNCGNVTPTHKNQITTSKHYIITHLYIQSGRE